MRITFECHVCWKKFKFSTNECDEVRAGEDWTGRIFHFPFGMFTIMFLKD